MKKNYFKTKRKSRLTWCLMPLLCFMLSAKSFAQTVTARGENPPNEGIDKLYDGDLNSKWLDFSTTSWVKFAYTTPVAWTTYSITSGNDFPERDPKDWTVQGSNDSLAWTTLSTETGQTFTGRNQTRTFALSNLNSYLYYKWNKCHWQYR